MKEEPWKRVKSLKRLPSIQFFNFKKVREKCCVNGKSQRENDLSISTYEYIMSIARNLSCNRVERLSPTVGRRKIMDTRNSIV